MVLSSFYSWEKLIFQCHSPLVKYWCIGMLADPSYNPRVSIFHKLGMRLNIQFTNRIFKRNKMNNEQYYTANISHNDNSQSDTYSQVTIKMISEVENLWTSPACQSEKVKQVSLKHKEKPQATGYPLEYIKSHKTQHEQTCTNLNMYQLHTAHINRE